MKEMLKKGNTVDVAIYDYGSGYAEIIDFNEQKNTVGLQWITFSSCYDCQKYDIDIYTEPSVFDIKDIAEITPVSLTPEEIAQRRIESIYYDFPDEQQVSQEKTSKKKSDNTIPDPYF